MTTRKKSSTYSYNEERLIECDLTYAINMIGGRWKLQLLYQLEQGKRRFSELKRAFPGITERMLTLQLKTMEQDGLVKRTIHAEIPPRVEYELTPQAHALIPVLNQLSTWGNQQRATLHAGIITTDSK